MSSLIKEFSLIALLTSIGAAFSLFHGWSPLPWAEPELGPGEIQLIDAQALDVIWLDARSAEAFAREHIPGALHVEEGDPDAALLQLMELWLPEPRPIVVYCGSESCDTSRRVADQLRASLPEAEIYSLKGGWDAWEQ